MKTQESIFTRNNDRLDAGVIARRKAAMGGFHQRMANAYRAEGLNDRVQEVIDCAKKHDHEVS